MIEVYTNMDLAGVILTSQLHGATAESAGFQVPVSLCAVYNFSLPHVRDLRPLL